MSSANEVSAYPPPKTFLGKLKEITFSYVPLSVITFGGPQAHIAILLDMFVTKKKWINETEFAELFAIANSLPGPASTELAFAIALLRAGVPFALYSFVLWSLPGGIVMALAGLGVASLGTTFPVWLQAIKNGLVASALGLVALASYKLGNKLVTDRITQIINLISLSLSINFFTVAWLFPVLMIFGGLTTLIWSFLESKLKKNPAVDEKKNGTEAERQETEELVENENASPSETQLNLEEVVNERTIEAPPPKKDYLNLTTGIIIVVFWVLLFVVAILLKSLTPYTSPWNVLGTFYYVGSIIFGGGPVVVPLLQGYVTQASWMSNSEFLIGFAIISVLPGPMFNFAAYCGALALRNSYSGLSSLFAWIGIFFPGLILQIAVIPVWRQYRSLDAAKTIFRGVNAAAAGLLFSAVYLLSQNAINDRSRSNANNQTISASPRSLDAFPPLESYEVSDTTGDRFTVTGEDDEKTNDYQTQSHDELDDPNDNASHGSIYSDEGQVGDTYENIDSSREESEPYDPRETDSLFTKRTSTDTASDLNSLYTKVTPIASVVGTEVGNSQQFTSPPRASSKIELPRRRSQYTPSFVDTHSQSYASHTQDKKPSQHYHSESEISDINPSLLTSIHESETEAHVLETKYDNTGTQDEVNQRYERLGRWGLDRRPSNKDGSHLVVGSLQSSSSALNGLIDAHAARTSIMTTEPPIPGLNEAVGSNVVTGLAKELEEQDDEEEDEGEELEVEDGDGDDVNRSFTVNTVSTAIRLDERLPVPVDYVNYNVLNHSASQNYTYTTGNVLRKEPIKPFSDFVGRQGRAISTLKKVPSEPSELSIDQGSKVNSEIIHHYKERPPVIQVSSEKDIKTAEEEAADKSKSWFQKFVGGLWGQKKPPPKPAPTPEPTLEALLVQHSQSRRLSRSTSSASDIIDLQPKPSMSRARRPSDISDIRKSLETRRAGRCERCDGTQFLPDGTICSNCADLKPTLYIEDTISEEKSIEEDRKSRISMTLKRISSSLFKRSTNSLKPPSRTPTLDRAPTPPTMKTSSSNSSTMVNSRSPTPTASSRHVRGRFGSDSEGGVGLRKKFQNAFKFGRRGSVVINKSSRPIINQSQTNVHEYEDEVWDRTPSPAPSRETLDPGRASSWMQEASNTSIPTVTRNTSIQSMQSAVKPSIDSPPKTSIELLTASTNYTKNFNNLGIHAKTHTNNNSTSQHEQNNITRNSVNSIDELDLETPRQSNVFLDGDLKELFRDLVLADLPLEQLAEKYMPEKPKAVTIVSPVIGTPMTTASDSTVGESPEATPQIPKTTTNVENGSVVASQETEVRWSTNGQVLAWMAANVTEIDGIFDEKSRGSLHRSISNLRKERLPVKPEP
ncbi:hypothetical protein HK098_004621 [Nowakowskiella sp. JEL0407]|nr:hypothetical protein HK098_004621 [Nowakowskiella sp. JEL0407]